MFDGRWANFHDKDSSTRPKVVTDVLKARTEAK